MRLFASCALAAVVAAGPFPRSAGAAATIQSSVLSNGVTVVTRQRPGSQVLAIDAAVRAGARYETDATASAARFLESALMLGTERWPSRDALVRAIAGRGGDLSVTAGREIVEVAVTVGLPDADIAMDVLGEVLLRSRFDPDDLERERDVLLQQVQEREDEPEDRATDVLYQTVFAGHPLAKLPFGTRDGVEQLTVDRLRGYWQERLVGTNVLVAVVSGLSHEQVVAKLEAALHGVPAGPVPALNYADIPTPKSRQVDLTLGTDQSHVFIAVPVPGVSTEDRAALRVLNAILGRTSGRLFTEVRDKRGLAYTAYSTVTQYVDGGIFLVYAGTKPSTAQDVLTLLQSELQRIREQAVGVDELANAIGGELGSRTLAVETSSNEATYMARDTVFGLPPREVQAEQTRAVTAADVQRVAQRYLDPSRFTVVVTGPGSGEQGDRP
ncbi:MAG: pitrilysin family protein [Chloroflexota bacterium]